MMRNVTSSLRTVLTVTATVIFLPTPLGVRAAVVPAGAAQASMSDGAKFVGTYRLITTEVKDAASGEWVQNPNFNSIGYITYGDTGHMGVHIMPRNRVRFASNPPSCARGYVRPVSARSSPNGPGFRARRCGAFQAQPAPPQAKRLSPRYCVVSPRSGSRSPARARQALPFFRRHAARTLSRDRDIRGNC